MTHSPTANAFYFTPDKYDLITGNSRWTSTNRNHAVHIASQGKAVPLCQKSYRNGVSDRWSFSWAESTCKKCRSKLLNRHPRQAKEILEAVK